MDLIYLSILLTLGGALGGLIKGMDKLGAKKT